jgi:hypothetical protein
MPQVTRQEIFAMAARQLRQDFEALTALHHGGLKGGEAEKLVRQFLCDHIPKRFDVTSGLILDQTDRVSRQTDVIIYDALNCPAYRTSETAAIIPSDNVAATVEVKSVLDKEQMRDAFAKASVIKGLAKTKPPNVPIPMMCQTLCFLFAFESPLTLDKLSEHYQACAREFGVGRHIDLVMVLDRGVIMLAGKTRQQGPLIFGWAPIIMEGFGGSSGEGAHIAVASVETKDSLDLFFRFLLADLMQFRGLVGHPGFWTKDPQPMMKLSYLTSVTHETDPNIRAERLRKYRDEVIAEFAQNPISPASPQTTETPSEKNGTPDVIYMPPLPPLTT